MSTSRQQYWSDGYRKAVGARNRPLVGEIAKKLAEQDR
jgi:hypothetical protein